VAPLPAARAHLRVLPPLDAYLVGQPPFLVLPPGGQGMLSFDVQNTGTTPWGPGVGIDLVHVDGTALGAANPQLLGGAVPVGQIAQWMVPVQAPRAFGVYRTSWQMAHDGARFGPVLSCAVIVLPYVEGLGTDYAALLNVWFKDLGDQMLAGIEGTFERWIQRFDGWFGDDLTSLSGALDRWWRSLEERVRQMGAGDGRGSE
jgi:hypothetical protein